MWRLGLCSSRGLNFLKPTGCRKGASKAGSIHVCEAIMDGATEAAARAQAWSDEEAEDDDDAEPPESEGEGGDEAQIKSKSQLYNCNGSLLPGRREPSFGMHPGRGGVQAP